MLAPYPPGTTQASACPTPRCGDSVETAHVERAQDLQREPAPGQPESGVLGRALDPRHHRQAAGLHEGDGRAVDHDLDVVALEQLTDALADLARVADVDVAFQLHGGRARGVRRWPGHRARRRAGATRRSPLRSRSGRSSGRGNPGGGSSGTRWRRPRACRRDRTRPPGAGAPAPAGRQLRRRGGSSRTPPCRRLAPRTATTTLLVNGRGRRAGSRHLGPRRRAAPERPPLRSCPIAAPGETVSRPRIRRAFGVSNRCPRCPRWGMTYQSTKYTPATIAAMIAATSPS